MFCSARERNADLVIVLGAFVDAIVVVKSLMMLVVTIDMDAGSVRVSVSTMAINGQLKLSQGQELWCNGTVVGCGGRKMNLTDENVKPSSDLDGQCTQAWTGQYRSVGSHAVFATSK